MLILASESPRRRELLGKIIEKFEVRSANVEEISAGTDLFCVPEINAKLKAQAVADDYPDCIVIGADTAIIFDDKFIGKPRDKADAERILLSFSGRRHSVVTGVAIIRTGSDPVDISFRDESFVEFKDISIEDIRKYMAQVHVLDKAGAYAIQEYAELIIADFTGSLDNIVGLPTEKLKEHLAALGVC